MKIDLKILDRQFELYKQEYENAALRVLRSGWYVLGPEVEAFENEFAESTLSEYFYYTKADFVSIPEQLVKVGEGKRIKFYNGTKLEKLLKKLYLLHPKN